MKKNLISVVFVLVLLVSFSTAIAMGDPVSQGAAGGKASGGNHAQPQAQAQTQTQTQTKTQTQTQTKTDTKTSSQQQPEMGKNNQHQPDGNTPCMGGGLETLATYLYIDTTDLTPEEVAAAITTAVEALDSTALSALADEMNIDTTDMTDTEILAAVEAVLTPPALLR